MKKGDDSKKQQPPQQPPQQPAPKKDMGPKVRAWTSPQFILCPSTHCRRMMLDAQVNAALHSQALQPALVPDIT